MTNPATDYVRNFVANVNPLNVLKLGSLMRPAAGMTRDGDADASWIRGSISRRELDAAGAVASVDGAGLPLRVGPRRSSRSSTAQMPCDWLLVASPEAPMRQAIEAMRNSGWPVLVVDDARPAARRGRHRRAARGSPSSPKLNSESVLQEVIIDLEATHSIYRSLDASSPCVSFAQGMVENSFE